LQVHLRPYEREGRIARWDDTRLKPGTNWREEIAEAIARAQVAILLVSADFLASEFITTDELPPLLEAAKVRGTKILPIIVGSCAFRSSPLSQFQAENDPSKPLAALPTHKRDEVWVKLAEDVAYVLREATQAPTSNNDAKNANPSIGDANDVQEVAERASGAKAERERAAWFRDALDFFAGRLARTFPGTSGLRIFHGQEALTRLARLLETPLTLSYHNDNAPLWWWRGTMNMYIDHFAVLNDQELRCLLWHDELLIDTVAVYRSPTRDYRNFVYVATRPDQPTGIYPIDVGEIEQDIKLYGYSREETGYWKGRHVSRAEYDDGYAEIEGQIVRLKGAEVRCRYLTPYNFFVASQLSVLNNVTLDSTFEELCQKLLKGEIELDDVVRVIEGTHLTERQQDYYEFER
jgi:hypothetical protein